jgi:predicted O-linked N-acetylglucosamine transferase (SPINDLY family)
MLYKIYNKYFRPTAVGRTLTLFRRQYSPHIPHSEISGEVFKNTGFRELESDNLISAYDNLINANKLNSEDGVISCLLGITAVRMRDTNAINHALSSMMSRQSVTDALKVGSWFLDSSRLGPKYELSASANWHAFEVFGLAIFEKFAISEHDMFMLVKQIYHLRFLNLSKKFLKTYIQKYGKNPEVFRMLVENQLALCELDLHHEFVQGLRNSALVDINSNVDCCIDPYSLLSMGIDYEIYSKVCKLRSLKIISDRIGHNSIISIVKRAEKRKIRIAFLLPYSWFSSLTMVLDSLLPHFDRHNFEIFGYSMQHAVHPDDFQLQFIAKFDDWKFIHIDYPFEAAKVIAQDEVDILIDTSGHTRVNCLPIAAYRPAKVQVHYLGYSNAICAPFIDYVIADEELIPSEIQLLCPEAFAFMPTSVMTYPRAQISLVPLSRSEIGLEDGIFYFCSFNYLTKVEPKIYSSWMNILSKVPGSKLALCHWNQPESVQNLRRLALASGITLDRICFLPPLRHDLHLRRLQLMDLALDTLYMGGGVTSMDCLWAGLPLLTVKPDCVMPHNGGDYLKAIGLPELIMNNLQEYEVEAILLASLPEKLNNYRSKLFLSKDNCIIFKPFDYVKNFESLLTVIWTKHTSNDPVATFCALPQFSI